MRVDNAARSRYSPGLHHRCRSNALDLRKGNLVRYEGNLSEVVYWNILKNDRRQFVQMRVKNLATGRIAELKEHGDTKFEVLDNEIVELSHSYRDGADEVFYSPEGEEHRCNHEVAQGRAPVEVRCLQGLRRRRPPRDRHGAPDPWSRPSSTRRRRFVAAAAPA